MIAFQRPDGQKTVKRLIGLPGETVRIDQGDIWINDERISRPLSILQSMLVPVYLDSFRCRTDDPARWQTDAEWLTYHHAACLAPPIGRANKPIFDSYGFNQTLSRELRTVSDVVFQCHVNWAQNSTSGSLRIRFPAGMQMAEFIWRSNGQLTLDPVDGPTDDAKPLETVAPQAVAPDDGIVTVGYIDGVVFFALNGRTRFHYKLGIADTELHQAESTAPYSVSVSNEANVSVRELTIARDIHYFANRGQQNQWQLGNDQFLLLGDNVPRSEDARQGSEFGVIRSSQILGRVVPPNKRPTRQRGTAM